MKHFLTALSVLTLLVLASCISLLEYPDYWSIDHGAVRNILTLPFEVLFTPIIFLLKLLPVF